MKIESENAKERLKELLEKCIKCGMCKALCPVFQTLREEDLGPRGRIILLENEIYDKTIYDCSLCQACEVKCPLNLKLCDAFKEARKILVNEKHETKENREMINNIRKSGNPFN